MNSSLLRSGLSLFIMANVGIAQANINPTLPRGESIVSHARQEICVIPKKLSFGAIQGQYSKKDLENEIKLCDLEMSQNAAVCGKVTSTNPGIQFYEVYPGMTISQMEELNCFKQDPSKEKGKNLFKKLAKYKSSTSCSYGPSLLAYYHVARFLGDINQVPVAVARTVDRNLHISIGQKAIPFAKKGSDIEATWGSAIMYLKQAQNGKKKDVLFSEDFKQSFGALQKNPRGEEKYGSEMFHGGNDQPTRTVNFKNNNVAYKLNTKPGSVKALVGTSWDAKNLQTLLQMQNVADMILLDTILSQEDRMGNIHYTEEYYVLEDGPKGLNVKREGKMEVADAQAAGALKVKKMMMKDNDCGVNRANHLKDAKLLEGLTHFNPETYTKLLRLKEALATEEVKSFFKTEVVMLEDSTHSDYSTFRKNVTYAADVLQKACRSGKLRLDLDLDAHFANKKIDVSCE